MAIEGLQINLDIFIRWLHVIAGITWIGHLYFFNWVNSALQPKLDKDTKRAVNPEMLPRALFWFRWGAMFTFIAGWILFTNKYMYMEGKGFGPTPFFSINGEIQHPAIWILLGMGLATVMWFNVWFIIWPAQQKIIPAIRDGNAPDAALAKRATFASKVNTYFSAPMLFCMLAPNHYPSLNIVTIAIFTVVSVGSIWLAYQNAAKVGTSI